MSGHRVTEGRPDRLGAYPEAGGVSFATWSAHAERVEVCLFSPDGRHETDRLELPGWTGPVRHGHVAGLSAGQLYGLRVHGPWAPEEGHLFAPAKLLIDPWARRLTGPVMGNEIQAAGRDPSGPCSRDSAAAMPKCVVEPAAPPHRPAWPRHDPDALVIYEAHLKGLTARLPGAAHPGTFAALAEPRLVAHLAALGVTTLELLPVQAFLTDLRLRNMGLDNYWGYQPVAWCAPHAPCLATPGAALAEMRAGVAALHAAGIEVVLDIVLNHSGEGDATGPHLSLRGLDNASFYRRTSEGAEVDDSGCGNSLDLGNPGAVRLCMDALRFWAGEVGVDGFRFDLATAMGRRPDGFDPTAPLLAAIAQDPLLAPLRMIAEPWDLGPGGYAAGRFPAPFLEWNDRFRDDIRRGWLGAPGRAPDAATALTASAPRFDTPGRAPWASVNFVTAHDGFTLADLTRYARPHNEANGENNRDGHWPAFCDNMGHEGPTDDPAITAARLRRMRAILASLLLAQGTPMILGGDEWGRSQSGNSNAYCHDSPLTWLDWEGADAGLAAFVSRLTALRRAHPALRARDFLHGTPNEAGLPDLLWWHPEGRGMRLDDWEDPGLDCLCMVLAEGAGRLVLALNAGAARTLHLPDPPPGPGWRLLLDSADPDAPEGPLRPACALPGQAVLLAGALA
ncbi:MAG: glycogen debranching protein GlgX [Rhodobacteraceae bacterium]|nr:glycogen debranching protein GlgX [Paracoccaceae bacterium]